MADGYLPDLAGDQRVHFRMFNVPYIKGSSSQNQRQTLVKYGNTKIGKITHFLFSLQVSLFIIGSVQSQYNYRTWWRVACWWPCGRGEFAAYYTSCFARFEILYSFFISVNKALSTLVPSTSLRGKESGKKQSMRDKNKSLWDHRLLQVPPPTLQRWENRLNSH